jgi:hypothetical protein
MYTEGGDMLFVPSDDEVVGFKARSAPRCSRRRSAGGADERRRELSWFVATVVSSDSTKTAAPRRTSQRAERATRQSERSERSNHNGAPDQLLR